MFQLHLCKLFLSFSLKGLQCQNEQGRLVLDFIEKIKGFQYWIFGETLINQIACNVGLQGQSFF